MTRDEITEKYLTLSFEFSPYVAQHSDFAAQIPPNSRVILLPGDDPELARINRETVERARQLDDKPDRPVVYIRFERRLPGRSQLAHRACSTRRVQSRKPNLLTQRIS